MKSNEIEVKTKGVVIATVDVPTYETIDEVLESLEEVKILSLVNRQNKADLTNKARADRREKSAGKGKRYETAINVLATLEFEDGETGLDKMNACMQAEVPKEALDELLSSVEVQAAVDEALSN